MNRNLASAHFSATYVEARQKFLDAASTRQAVTEAFTLPGHRGALDEDLSIDIAYVGAIDARQLVILSSGTHGPEGFCGSACQVAALHDDDLAARLARSDVALLLIHAVNPYGFSHMQRTNQDNVDLNRNHIDFDRPLPRNDAYPEVDALLLPQSWPPSRQDEQALANYVARHGLNAYQRTVSGGQYTMGNGMFYGGSGPTWNNLTMRSILRKYAANAMHIAWIDVHTGLGPCGHGEKIYAGPNVPAELARARAWWGGDVFSTFDGESESPEISGSITTIAYDECPDADISVMALEFGTLPFDEVLYRMRAMHWLLRNPGAPAAQHNEIRRQVRDAFYCDNDEWKGAVWGQSRVALLQALVGLARA
jgi:hypothetical protein